MTTRYDNFIDQAQKLGFRFVFFFKFSLTKISPATTQMREGNPALGHWSQGYMYDLPPTILFKSVHP